MAGHSTSVACWSLCNATNCTRAVSSSVLQTLLVFLELLSSFSGEHRGFLLVNGDFFTWLKYQMERVWEKKF